MFDIKITYSSCDSKFPLEFSASTKWKPGLRMGPLLPSTASLWRTNTATPRHSGQSWTGCSTISPWSTHSLYWVEGWSIISRSAANMAD